MVHGIGLSLARGLLDAPPSRGMTVKLECPHYTAEPATSARVPSGRVRIAR